MIHLYANIAQGNKIARGNADEIDAATLIYCIYIYVNSQMFGFEARNFVRVMCVKFHKLCKYYVSQSLNNHEIRSKHLIEEALRHFPVNARLRWLREKLETQK